jgi:hypothetical protein
MTIACKRILAGDFGVEVRGKVSTSNPETEYSCLTLNIEQLFLPAINCNESARRHPGGL